MKIERVNVLGVGISALNMELARAAVANALEKRQKGYVAVRDVHGVSLAQTDPEFRRILNEAFLCTPDGMPLVWLGRRAGFKNMDRVYGPDLMLEICQMTRDSGHTHFLYGGGEGVAQELKTKLEARFPGLKIVAAVTPPFRPLDSTEEEALIRQVAELKPDIIWVGLSTPKQERFMAKFLPRLDTTLMFGVGAAFDFHTGRVRQAPRWIQRSGFEWCYRLCQEPRRLGWRYAKNNTLFICQILVSWLGLKRYPLD